MQDADNDGLDSSASDSHPTLFLNATTTVHFFKIDKAGWERIGRDGIRSAVVAGRSAGRRSCCHRDGSSPRWSHSPRESSLNKKRSTWIVL